MEDPRTIGAIIGAIAGYIISMAIFTPKFRHLGGGWFSKEGGAGLLKGCLVGIVFAVVGAIIGMLIASQ